LTDLREMTTDEIRKIEEIEAERSLEMKMWSPEKFLKEVENYSRKYDEDIIDSVMYISKKYEISETVVAKDLMSDRLYYLLRETAEDRRLIRKEPSLVFG